MMALTIKEIIDHMCAEVRGEIQGPETLQGMIALFEQYRRAVRIAEHNRSGHNPSMQGKLGKIVGDRFQAKADRLATQFPRFPEILKKLDK